MPTSTEQVVGMRSVIDRYLQPEQAEGLFRDLYDEVGQHSTNLSVKLSLLMLSQVYARDGRSLEDKLDDLRATFASYYINPKLDKLLGVLLVLVVLLHFAFLGGLLAALCVLPFAAAWYQSLPLCSFIVFLLVNPVRCPLTGLENKLRTNLGMPEIRHFVLHYVVRPSKRLLRKVSK